MPKREIRPAEKPDPAEVKARLERDQAAQDNYDAQQERNAEALAQDPAQQELYRREREGMDFLEGTKKAASPENKQLSGPSANKSAEPPDGSPRLARTRAKANESAPKKLSAAKKASTRKK